MKALNAGLRGGEGVESGRVLISLDTTGHEIKNEVGLPLFARSNLASDFVTRHDLAQYE